MALSGSKSIQATSQDTLRFSWSATQSIANNTSTVSWKMELIAGSAGYIASSASKKWSVVVNGVTYSGSNTIGISNNTTKTLASGTTVINHNADGSKSFSFSFSQQFSITFGGTSVGTKSGSGTGTLNNIPRAASITSAPNFNDEQNPTISYSNPLGNNATSLQACITNSDGSAGYADYRDISKTGTSYTFNLTSAEREALRKASANSKSITVRFYIKTVIGGSTYYSYINKTLSIVNAAPTVTASAYDTGTVTTPLTGNTSKMLKGFNAIAVSMSAAALKGATIKSYKITNGNVVINAASGKINNTNDNAFVFSATDSRGNTTSKTITLNMIDYIDTTCNISAKISLNESDSTKANINFTISGNYYNGSLGAVNNALTLSYELTDSNGGKSTVNLDASKATISGNTYTITHTINNLDYKKSYVLKAIAADKAKTWGASSTSKTLKTTPIFDWGENDFNFNVPVSINNIELDYIVEQGQANGWQYTKWNSGKAECSKRLVFNTSITLNWGSLFVSSARTERQSYPFVFTSTPVEVVTLQSGNNAVWLFTDSGGNGANGAYASARYGVCRPTSIAASEDYYLSYYVVGRWK